MITCPRLVFREDDFIPALMTIFTQDGKTYALPKDWGTLGLIYLPEAFQAAGVDEPTDVVDVG